MSGIAHHMRRISRSLLLARPVPSVAPRRRRQRPAPASTPPLQRLALSRRCQRAGWACRYAHRYERASIPHPVCPLPPCWQRIALLPPPSVLPAAASSDSRSLRVRGDGNAMALSAGQVPRWIKACGLSTCPPTSLLHRREDDADIHLLVALPLLPAHGLDRRLDEGAKDVGRDERPAVFRTPAIIRCKKRAARRPSRR